LYLKKRSTEEKRYKTYNIWLVQCRRYGGLKTYLKIEVRPNNGTIHFRPLTNDFMQIKKVNGYMAYCFRI